MPDTMLAAAIDGAGGPEVLSIRHVPVPEPKPGEVLLAVQAAGVGAWEAGIRQDPGECAHFPLVLGFDGAGTVVAMGVPCKVRPISRWCTPQRGTWAHDVSDARHQLRINGERLWDSLSSFLPLLEFGRPQPESCDVPLMQL